MANGTIDSDPLFGGLTRPPVFLGVPQFYFVLNLLLLSVLFINFDEKINCLISSLLIHLVGYLMGLKEPRFMDLLMIKYQKCNRCRNKLFHGANSYDPY